MNKIYQGEAKKNMAVEIGKNVQGKVTGLAKFGAFVEIDEGKTGLVHISEVSDPLSKILMMCLVNLKLSGLSPSKKTKILIYTTSTIFI